MILSDTDKLYFKLIEKIYKLFPLLENVSVFYRNEKEIKFIQNNVYTDVSTSLKSKIDLFRLSSLNYQWILPKELDFGIFENENRFLQLDLLDEHENRLLILNFKSKYDQLNDFVCITFPKDIRFLGMYKSLKNLSTDDKILLGELIFKMCSIEIEEYNKEIKIQSRLLAFYELKTNLSLSYSSENISINYIKNELTLNLKKKLRTLQNIDFSNELIQYIYSNLISISEVTEYLTEAFEVISILEKSTINFRFELIHLQLILNETKSQNVQDNNSKIESKDKIEEILDKLENAAQKADNAGIVINGKSVAQFQNPSVSPPAVTDILKKNINKIELKLGEYPNKWILIRKHLKPLRDLEFKNILLNQKLG